MRAEHAAVRVQLVDDNHAEICQQASPAAVVGQQAVVQDVRVGEQDGWRGGGEIGALVARGIAGEHGYPWLVGHRQGLDELL